MNSIGLAEDGKSVRVGGGVLTGSLVDFLDERGLVTACTLAGVVGHVGWAFGGGFGPLVNSFGLGVEQILSAQIITADGAIQDADAELLWGIKGAGGAFGVVTEVVLKVYPLKKMLGGSIMFAVAEAQQVISRLEEMVKKEVVPRALTLGFHFSKREGMPVLMANFSWAAEEFEEGRMWLEKIKGVGTVIMDMVAETSIKKWSDRMKPMLPPPSYNTSRSVLLSSHTPAAIEILTSAIEKIPEGVQFGIGTFLVFGEAVRLHPESSFHVQEPCVFIHALAPVSDPSRIGESRQWTDGVYNGLQKAGLVKSNYPSILATDMAVVECFGKENFERLKVLKQKVDPKNIFRQVPVTF